MVKDVIDGTTYDLLIAGISAACLIFIIMLLMTRSLIAAVVIVGTVVLSLGASFGLSVLVWQYLVGLEIHWVVMVMSLIVLLAVGSDYNLLLVSRMKEEIGAGINTGIIRAMGGSGKVVTAAGLVFALTMGSMIVSDLRVIAQIGTTIAPRSVVRHVGRACIHDAIHRGIAGTLVLVAATSAPPPRQCPTSAGRVAFAGTFLDAEGRAKAA